jgi:hypothetical protein
MLPLAARGPAQEITPARLRYKAAPLPFVPAFLGIIGTLVSTLKSASSTQYREVCHGAAGNMRLLRLRARVREDFITAPHSSSTYVASGVADADRLKAVPRFPHDVSAFLVPGCPSGVRRGRRRGWKSSSRGWWGSVGRLRTENRATRLVQSSSLMAPSRARRQKRNTCSRLLAARKFW